jgi:HlyD family secretion protein
MLITTKRILTFASAVGIIGLIIAGLRPAPVEVDGALVERGPLQITVDDEGETRVKDRFVVAAPVSGRLERINLLEGDQVRSNQVVATIRQLPLDPRQREEILARVRAAEALVREATEHMAHARTDYEQARRDRERAERLMKDGVISIQVSEQARVAETTSANELEAARQKVEAASSDVTAAQAGLIGLEAESTGDGRIVRLHSPTDGQVLRVIEKSERVVAAGVPLLIVGDPSKLEVVSDFLSTEAVKVRPGMPVIIERWGGPQPLRGRVRVIEPYAFTKVSALGIEEQRVNLVADLLDPPGPLADGYRVAVRVITWSSDRVLKIPSSTLFRDELSWNAFVIVDGRAQRRQVDVLHRNAFEAEIGRGLSIREIVIAHPSNQLEAGVRVRVRPPNRQ